MRMLRAELRFAYVAALMCLPLVGVAKEKGADDVTAKVEELWEASNSTPGTQLIFKEVEREKIDQSQPGKDGSTLPPEAFGKTLVTYTLLAAGFHKAYVYTLWGWSLGQEPRPFRTGYSVDDTGKLVCSPGHSSAKEKRAIPWCEEPLEAFTLGMTGARGEPKRIALFSEDLKVRNFAKTIPFPIEAKDGPCRLAVELAEPVGEGFEIIGEGFQPGEDVDVMDQSEDEVMHHSQKANRQGQVGGYELPAVIGKNSGSASWEVKSQACHLKVEYKWGKAAFEWQ